jgi:hypothetical protein
MAGMIVVMGVAGVASAQDGFIKARGKPGAAGVFVDGKYAGPAERFTVPEKYAVSPGEHEIVLRDPRYEDFTVKVSVKAKKTSKISYHLKKLPEPQGPFGRLRFGGGEAESFISVAQGDTSAVFLNGKFYGYIDELNNAGGGLLLPAGKYELKVSSPIFGEINQVVSIEANKVSIVPLKK